jgi:hypothetical protein
MERLGEIKKNLVAIRGLEFVNEVPISIEKQDVIRRYLEADLLEDYGEEKLRNLSRAYTKLGLLPAGSDLKDSLLNFYTAKVLGFYSPKSKGVMLTERPYTRILSDGTYNLAEGDLNEMTLAHELTHALQDQHFSLRQRLRPSDNDDKTLALRALAEGDAILTEFAYLSGGLDKWSPTQINQVLQNSSKQLHLVMSRVPAAIVDKLLFQHRAGASFVYRLLSEKGWSGINLLYGSPPLSTKQVLHPEKYLDLPDPPTRVDLTDLSILFPSGWTEIENNTLGELMVRCLFKEFFSQKEAEVVAGGWDGDRFVAFRRGDQVSFIWATVWDSAEDAEEFFQKYQEIVARKYGSSPSSKSHFYIEKCDRLVIVVEGLERAHIEKSIEKVFQGVKLTKETFKHPFPPREPLLSNVSPHTQPGRITSEE